MSRTGKIARLPRAIREQLNRRLDDGESAVEAAAWLNALPAVREVLKKEFAERPINEQNLTEWKQGGFGDWQKQQEALALARELTVNADELIKSADASLADKMSPLLVARYMAIIQNMAAIAGGAADDWKVLRELCSDIVALRKGDHSAERLKIERERLRWS